MKTREPMSWLMAMLTLTLVSMVWCQAVNFENAWRWSNQSRINDSPPLLPDWLVASVPVFVVVQFVLSVVAVLRVRSGRGWLAAALAVLWAMAAFVALCIHVG